MSSSHSFTLLLIAVAILAGAAAVLAAHLRERIARRRLDSGDIAYLHLCARRAGRRPPPSPLQPPAALAAALQDRLAALPGDQLVRLGDAALVSAHPFAATVFDTVYDLLAGRRTAAAEALRRRAAWPDLRAPLAPLAPLAPNAPEAPS
jgi:hypothetical protein